jgi:hypothetical protein
MVDAGGQRIGTLWLNRFGLNSLKQVPLGLPPRQRQYFLYWEVKDGLLLLGNRSREFSTASGRLIRAAARIPGATFLSGIHAYYPECAVRVHHGRFRRYELVDRLILRESRLKKICVTKQRR